MEKLIWKPYEFYEKFYYVSQYGDIKNSDGKLMKTFYNSDGYLRLQFTAPNGIKEERKVHRLVAELFVEKPNTNEELEVDHIDCIRDNNYYKNLRWISHYDNIKHCIEEGNHHSPNWNGNKNPKSRLDKKDVLFIRQKYQDGLTIREIYKKYYFNKCTESTIEHICKRKTWKDI